MSFWRRTVWALPAMATEALPRPVVNLVGELVVEVLLEVVILIAQEQLQVQDPLWQEPYKEYINLKCSF